MLNLRHDATIDYIVEKESRKGGFTFLGRNVRYSNDRGDCIGEMDVCKIQERDGKKQITYYEVKTGDGRKKARSQARNFYRHHKDWDAYFIYVSTKYGVEYWPREQFQKP